MHYNRACRYALGRLYPCGFFYEQDFFFRKLTRIKEKCVNKWVCEVTEG